MSYFLRNVVIDSQQRITIEVKGDNVAIAVAYGGATMAPEKVDELIRALGLARVELSKARPQS